MDILITDREISAKLLRRRRAWGGDHHDEVWNGVYVMSPLANDEHQRMVMEFAFILMNVLGPAGNADVRPGVNVTDREVGWKKNYRVPDVVVRYHDGRSQIRDTHWFGGPDFLIEVASRGDRSRKKRPFYASIGVREMLIVDRHPWALELYRLDDGELNLVGRSTLDDPAQVVSEVVPLWFRLVAVEDRPRIEVVQSGGPGRWVV